MPEDQVTTTTPRRRSRRQETPAEMRQLPLADQASAAETATDGAVAAPAKPVRRRAAKATEAAPRESAPEAPTPVEFAAPVAPTDSAEAAPRSGARGPRVSRPRATRGASAPEATTAPIAEFAPVTVEAPAEQRPAIEATTDASVPAPRPTRARGRRGFAPGVETTTEITETASGVHVIREMPRTDSAVQTPAEGASATPPSGDAFAEAGAPVVRTPYRFRRKGAAAQFTQANDAAPEATNVTPPAEASSAVPTDRTAETDERATPSENVVRPLRRSSWNTQDGREGAPYSGRDRATPHIPGGNDPYQRRGADQAHPAQGQPQHPTRLPVNRPGYQRGQNPPASQRGGAPYNPGAGGQNGQNGQDQRGGAPGYERQQPYGQRGEIPPYVPYNPYEPYPGYPTGPQQGTPQDRPARGRGYPQQQPGYPAAYPGYGEQPRGGRGNGRTAGDYYTQNNPRDRRGYPDRDRRNNGGNNGRGVNRPGRDRDAYANPAAPAYTPTEGRYTNGRQQTPAVPVQTVEINGLLWLGGGSGMSPAELLDSRTLQSIGRLNMDDVRRLGLRSGDLITGQAEERGGRRIVVSVETLNGQPPEELRDRPQFETLTASFPDRRIRLEHSPQPVSARIIDLFAPLGFGSRALVVAPPKTGKTTLIREAAESVLTGYPDAVVMAVLVGERPEEVTDLRARLEPRGGLVYAASFDEDTQRHAWLVQVAVERAKRVAESGRDAFMVLDSLTRLARAENLASRGAGRTLSGGIDAQALDTGRRAFGAARNLEEGGSITILATCLVDTGSRQDEVVYEEFKGTGNMELHLSRELSQRRLFPAVDAIKSGTRREEMLLTPEELRASTALRRRLADLPPFQATQQLLQVMERTQSNAALLQAIEQSGWMTATR